jgi:hypothetical protein
MPNPTNYTDLGNGTVKDNVTGLVWQQILDYRKTPEWLAKAEAWNNHPSSDTTIQSPALSWQQAFSYCQGLVLGGHDDWRMPTRIELVSLMSLATCNNVDTRCTDKTVFPAEESLTLYWSSSPYVDEVGTYWTTYSNEFLTLPEGGEAANRKYKHLQDVVRCVR